MKRAKGRFRGKAVPRGGIVFSDGSANGLGFGAGKFFPKETEAIGRAVENPMPRWRGF